MTKEEEMQKRLKRKRKSKETIRFDGWEYTVAEVMMSPVLRGRWIRRLEGYVKQWDRARNNMLDLHGRSTNPQIKAYIERSLDEMGTDSKLRGCVAALKAYHLNGGKPVQAARA